MRNTLDLGKSKPPAEFSPEYVIWCAKLHVQQSKHRLTLALAAASALTDEIAQCEAYIAGLGKGPEEK